MGSREAPHFVLPCGSSLCTVEIPLQAASGIRAPYGSAISEALRAYEYNGYTPWKWLT